MWGGGWGVNSLLLHFQDLWLPLMFLLTVNPSSRGHSQGWMSHSTQALSPCLGSVSWSSSQPLHHPSLMSWRCFRVRGPCPAAPTSMASDSRFCEGSTGLLHTLVFTALLTWSSGIDQSQGSRSWGHCCSQNPLLHPDSPAPSPQPQACPILCPFFTPSQVSSLQFSKS